MEPTLCDGDAIDPLPRSIAIAGAWGYIGRKFLDVALEHGLTTFVFDPGPMPRDLVSERYVRIESEADFYRLHAELFHLAVHPEHRRVERLLDRPDSLIILNEKPMAGPDHPEQCREIIEAAEASPSVMLYDFPELFDPLTHRILDFLARFRHVQIHGFKVQRSKDREDPANPRNYKRMVPIQYQESVHCLAFVLHIMAAVRGGLDEVLGSGVSVRGVSDAYAPPNPDDYPHEVDGRCRFLMSLENVQVEGCTDFKRGADWVKRRVIHGLGDGSAFEIDVSYLEGEKALRFNGVEQQCDPRSSSYEHVLRSTMKWTRESGRAGITNGQFPNPRFARMTYQLSSALWRSCRNRDVRTFRSVDELIDWDARYREAIGQTRAE